MVHQSVEYTQQQSPFNYNTTECIIITAKLLDTYVSIENIYIPLQTSCPLGFSASLQPLLTNNCLIVGDINAHNEAWSQGNNDPRGDALVDEIDRELFVALNNPDVNTRPTSNLSPDIAFASVDIALAFEWNVTVSLNSDHLSISLTLENNLPPSRILNSFTSFR